MQNPVQMGAYDSELPYDPDALVELLAERLRSYSDERVFELLQPILDPLRVEPMIEYLGRRVLKPVTGEHDLQFHLTDGHLRRTELEHRPIRNEELEHLARVG